MLICPQGPDFSDGLRRRIHTWIIQDIPVFIFHSGEEMRVIPAYSSAALFAQTLSHGNRPAHSLLTELKNVMPGPVGLHSTFYSTAIV